MEAGAADNADDPSQHLPEHQQRWLFHKSGDVTQFLI